MKEQINKEKQKGQKFEEIKREIRLKEEEQKKKDLEREEKQKQASKQREEFYEKIKNSEYFEDLLNSGFFEEIKNQFFLNSVALGVDEKPLLKVDLDENENPTAHLDTAAEQQEIRFISSDHQDIFGKVLPKEQSSIYEVLQVEEQEPQEPQEGEQVVIKQLVNYQNPQEISEEEINKRGNWLFIPDVVKTDKQIHFYNIPMLGSQLSMKMTLENFPQESHFDEFVSKQTEYNQKLQEVNEQREKDEQEYQGRLQEMQEKGEDTQELEEERQQVKYEEVVLGVPNGLKKDYVFVFDNMGQDKIISQQMIEEIKRFVIFYENKWNNQYLADSQNDAALYIQLEKQNQMEKFIEEEEEILNEYQEFEKDLEEKLINKNTKQQSSEEIEKELHIEKQDETDIEYMRRIIQTFDLKGNDFVDYLHQEFRTKQYIEQVIKNKENIESYFKLKNCKFQRLFQLLCYLLGKKKQEVNLDGTNIFDWRKFTTKLKEKIYEEITEYKYEGLKQGEYKQYNKVDFLEKQFESIDVDAIKQFSYPFFIVLRLAKNLCALRLQDIKKRQQEEQKFNQIREDRILQKNNREELMKKELEIAKQEFYSNFDENEQKEENQEEEETPVQNNRLEFDEQEWIQNWTEQNPKIQIPEEIQLALDEDVTEEFFKEEQTEES